MKRTWHKQAKAFYNQILKEFELSPDEVSILDGCTDQLSTYWRAADQLTKDGLTFVSETGQIRQHPAVGIQKNSWAGFLSGCRLLQIGTPEQAKARPGRPDGGHKGANI